MLDEKKVRVSDFVRQILEFDAVRFNFVKSNGDGNINAYLNKLVPILFKLKRERRMAVFARVEKLRGAELAKLNDAQTFINEVNTVSEETVFSDSEFHRLSQCVWIRPTKGNVAVFDEITESEAETIGLEPSVYIRCLLNEYSCFPQYKREQIAFDEECVTVLQARDSGRILKFRYEGAASGLCFRMPF